MDSSRNLDAEKKDETSIVMKPSPDYPVTCRMYSMVVESTRIKCFLLHGNFWLCFPEIIDTALRNYSREMIDIACYILRINLRSCNGQQLARLKAAGAIEEAADSCELISMLNTDRLCDFLMESGPVNLVTPFEKFVRVSHDCYGGCNGIYIPQLDVEYRARCIRCNTCLYLFSPPQFVCHTHNPQASNIDTSVDPMLFGDHIKMNPYDVKINRLTPCRDRKYRSSYVNNKSSNLSTGNNLSASQLSSSALSFHPNPISESTTTLTVVSSVTNLPTVCAPQCSYITVPGTSDFKLGRVNEPSNVPPFSTTLTCFSDQSTEFLNIPSVVSSPFAEEHRSSVIAEVFPSEQASGINVPEKIAGGLSLASPLSSSYNPNVLTWAASAPRGYSYPSSEDQIPVTCMPGISLSESSLTMPLHSAGGTDLSVRYSVAESPSINLPNLYTVDPRFQPVLSEISGTRSSSSIPISTLTPGTSSSHTGFASTQAVASGSSVFESNQTIVGSDMYHLQQTSEPLTRTTTSFSKSSPVLKQGDLTCISNQKHDISVSGYDNSEKLGTLSNPSSIFQIPVILPSSTAASVSRVSSLSNQLVTESIPVTVIHYLPSKSESSVDNSGNLAVFSHSSNKKIKTGNALSLCTSQTAAVCVSSQATTSSYASNTNIQPTEGVSEIIPSSCLSSPSIHLLKTCPSTFSKMRDFIDKPAKQLALKQASRRAKLPLAEGVVTANFTLPTYSESFSSVSSRPSSIISSISTHPLRYDPRMANFKIETNPPRSFSRLRSRVSSGQPAASVTARGTASENVSHSASSAEHTDGMSPESMEADCTGTLIKVSSSSTKT